MKPILQRFLLGGATLGLIAGASSAAVTLTQDTLTVAGDPVPVYIVENQFIKFVVVRGGIDWTPTLTDHVPDPYTGAIGGVLALYDKTGPVPDASQLTVIGTQGTANNPPYANGFEWPGLSHGRSFIAFRDRMNARDPDPTTPTITASLNAGATEARIVVEEDSLITGFHIKKTYILRDNEKWVQTDFAWTNNTGANYTQPGTSSAIESIIYATPGGAKDANDTQFGMVGPNGATGAVAGLNANVGNQWYGKGGTPLVPPLSQGWLSVVDPANTSVLATTWDLAQQQAVSTTPGIAGVRGGSFGSRFTFEILYETIPAGETLNFTHNLIVDHGLTELTYAKEGQLLAAVETKDAYNIESAVTATFKINSLNPTSAVTYDIKNIRVENRATGTQVSDVTLPDINGINVASNANVTAGTRQFTPRAPGFTVNESYVVKGDLYVSGQGTPVTTLSSRPFQINPANAKVFLYQDAASGDYVLENEVYRAVISAAKGEVSFFFLKDPTTGSLIRGQTVTSTPPYPMFRDFVRPTGGQTGFGNYAVFLDPNGTDSGTEKSIQFIGGSSDNAASITKTYSLASMSRTLAANLQVEAGTLAGAGYYSEVPMAPGGTSGASDLFSAHTADGLLIVHPDAATITSDTEFWMGAKSAAGDIVPGELPELDQGWMAMRDSSTTDALAITWDLAKQKAYSLTPTGAAGKETMNSLLIRSDYNQLARVHFTNFAENGALDTTMYLMADTGFKLVSYAEANRVMAGIWAVQSNNPAGSALDATIGLTNTSTSAKTFDVKNIRIVKDTGESTPAGADVTGIAIAAADHAAPATTFTLPAGQAAGVYTIQADLYEGATKLATLVSPTFNVTGAVVGGSGDINNDTVVDKADVTLALKIAGGLVASDSGQVSRGDLNGDGKISVEDATAIARKAAQP
jgi:hypothetical protein